MLARSDASSDVFAAAIAVLCVCCCNLAAAVCSGEADFLAALIFFEMEDFVSMRAVMLLLPTVSAFDLLVLVDDDASSCKCSVAIFESIGRASFFRAVVPLCSAIEGLDAAAFSFEER